MRKPQIQVYIIRAKNGHSEKIKAASKYAAKKIAQARFGPNYESVEGPVDA